MVGMSIPSPNSQRIVMWVIWFAILQGLFVIRLFAAPKFTPEQEAMPLVISPIAWIALGSACISMIVRWLIIPRITEMQPRLTAMIVGLALAEGGGILGMFACYNAQESTLLFTVSAACVFLSAPIYTFRNS